MKEARELLRSEKPILFSPDLAQKVHLGLKTETRRLMKNPPVWKDGGWYWRDKRYDNGMGADYFHTATMGESMMDVLRFSAPYQPGDLLYVRETWGFIAAPPRPDCGPALVIHRGEYGDKFKGPWRPSIHMPKWAARTWLEVLSVSVERVQEITEEGALAEGYLPTFIPSPGVPDYRSSAREQFAASWEKRYPSSWRLGEWVFVYKFRKTAITEDKGRR